MEMVNNQVFMFSIGLNNYNQLYKRCIQSQKNYAQQYNYSYQLINSADSVSITASAWLKIPLLIQALKQGFEWVFFIDADCEIQSTTPPIQSLAVTGKSLYMAQGFSGHINSGVIIIHNNPAIILLLESIYAHCNIEVATADWGENGHLIYFAENWPELQILDYRWNNNSLPKMQDHIRHYSAGGPMRQLYPQSTIEKILFIGQLCINRFKRKKYLLRKQTYEAVEVLMQNVEVF